MKTPWEIISSGLDQLFFSSLIEDETTEERADCIEAYLKFNGWTWDQVLEEMEKELTSWITPPSCSN